MRLDDLSMGEIQFLAQTSSSVGTDPFVMTFRASGVDSASTTANVTVTDTYDDGRPASVPEPGTLAIASLALLALVRSARVRGARKA
jgi:PEP-CTERM motif